MTNKHQSENSKLVESQLILEAIEQIVYNGSLTFDPNTIEDTSIRDRFVAILSEIQDTQQFALAISNGDLSRNLPVKGYLAGSLKSLQSSLRHLTWQTAQIASGDLTQRVHFMGDFSASFNSMVNHLAGDITERKHRESELLRVNQALAREVDEYIRLEKALNLTNKKLSLLSSITRHDIRNQLLALMNYIALSRKIIEDPKLLESYFEREERAVNSILNHINFSKDYEGLGVKEPVWNDLESIITDVISQLPLSRIKLVNSTFDIEIYADLLVQRVFYNLIDNAIRYGGPSITEIRIFAEEKDNKLSIIVQDDGTGIDPEDKSKLFTRGYGKNTGFGLFLSREILSLTDISIVEDSEPGAGARFRITVPSGTFRNRKNQ